MAGSAPPPAAAAYEEWILETIDSLRSRKARPDLERICRMVRRRHGPEPERTRQELERMVQRRAVLRVSYKGSISYRNAARLQPPRRSRGGGGGGGKAGNPAAAAGCEQEGAHSGHEGGGSPRQGESARRGPQEEGSPRPRAPEGGSPRQGGLAEGGGLKDGKVGGCNLVDVNCAVVQPPGSKKEGALGDYPKEGNLGVQGFGSAADALFGMQGFGSPKDNNMPGEASPKGVNSGRQELGCSKEGKFGVLEEVDPKNGKLGGPGDWSLADRKLWLQGSQSPKECQQEAMSGVLGGWSPKDMKLGALGGWNHKDGKFGVLAGRSPKELMSGMHRPLSPMDCKLGIQASGTLKEVIPGMQADGSPQNGKLGVQEWGNSKNGKCGVHSDSKAKDWKHGVQGGGTHKDGKLAVSEKGSSREIVSVSQGGRNLKDGKLGAQGGGRYKEVKHGVLGEGIYGVQDKPGMLDSLCLAREKGGELGEEKQVVGDGILGIMGPGSLGEAWVSGETTSNNGYPGVHGGQTPREENMEERSRRTIGSKSIELRGKMSPEKGIPHFDGVGDPMDVVKESFTANEIKSCKDAARGLKSREQDLQNEKRLAEQSLESLVKEGHRESVSGSRGRGSTGTNKDSQSQSQGDQQTPKSMIKGLLEHESSESPDSCSLEATGVQHQSMRRAKHWQEEDEQPSKRPRTESPEPGGERSRRSLGLSPNPAVPPIPNTRSGSRRPPSAAPPRVERLTRARGRWQLEEEQNRVRPQRSRSRPDRSLVRPQDSSTGSSIQSSRATRSKKMEEDIAKDEREENVSMASEVSELLETDDDKARTCVDKNKDTAPAAEPDLARGEKHLDAVPCDKDLKKECSGKDDPVVSKDAQLESLVAKPFNSSASDCHPGTTVKCLPGTTVKCMCDDLSFQDKNASMCNTTGHRFKKEECDAKTLSSVKNHSGCSTNIDPLDKGSSMSETICPRAKNEEGCNAAICPLVECAVKALPVKSVKLEDHSGEPRDCEASLGIEGVEPHLPVRVSPVTPMILAMDRNSYRKISVTKKPSDPVRWTVMDVVQYFTEAGFAEQASAFKEQEIDGKSLLLMQRTDVLTGLSIRLGPALKMYEHHIKILQQCHFAEENDFLG